MNFPEKHLVVTDVRVAAIDPDKTNPQLMEFQRLRFVRKGGLSCAIEFEYDAKNFARSLVKKMGLVARRYRFEVEYMQVCPPKEK